MGNHEFCTNCHASDFHIGMSCEEAYPEKLKKANKERAERKKAIAAGEKWLEEIHKMLTKKGIRCFIETNSAGGKEIVIHWYDRGEKPEKKKKDDPADEFYMGG